MKRKLFLSSAVIPALLAFGAMGQVVNFQDGYNGFGLNTAVGLAGGSYNELFAGQGAYSDPGNDVWNGYGMVNGYGSTWFFSASAGASGSNWPEPVGNPGNPYAAYSYAGSGWISSTGTSLFNATPFGSGGPTVNGDADSSGQWTPITLSVAGYAGDTYITPNLVPNGAPVFLFSSAAFIPAIGPTYTGPFSNIVFSLQNVPPGTYGLYLYGASPENNGGTAFSLNSGSAHNGVAATLNSGVSGAPAQTFVEGQNFVIFESVTPNASSNIIITASPNPLNGVGNSNLAGYTYVNGFQLIFNPPPTAVGSTAAQNVWAGGTANFSFSPAFAVSPSFRWQSIIGGVTNTLSDGGNVSGSGTTNLTIKDVAMANVGLYECLITTATATNTSPAAPLTILTNTATGPLLAGDATTIVGNVLQPSDLLSDFNNTNGYPFNSVPPPFNMTVINVEDNTLDQYENFGTHGSTAPFDGPVGFTVTPNNGPTIVTAMRLFTASRHPEDDPADYLLQGSNDGGTNFTTIAGGLLALPAQRNAAGGAINITNQVLQEIDFDNTTAYATYRLTFTNVNDNDTASNGVQIAEVQLLGSLAAVKPTIVQQPPASAVLLPGNTVNASLTASGPGPGPLTYQWYYNTSTQIPNATNAALRLTNVQSANDDSYTCVVSNPYGSTTSTPFILTVLTPTPYEAAVLADRPLAFYPLNETSGTTAFDIMGGYNGAYLNAPTLDVPGPSSYLPTGVNFDGSNQCVFIPDTPALNFAGQITLEAWVQPDATQPSGSFGDIIAKGYDGSQNDDEIQIRVQYSTSFFGAYYSSSDEDVGAGGGVVTTNWTYVVLTWDGAYWNLYVNGIVEGTDQDPIGLLYFSDPWAIADGTTSGDTRYFGGNISAAAIYDHALTPSQVAAHYDIVVLGTTNLPPVVTVPTAAVIVSAGGTGYISSSASGPPPITYQWFYAVSGTTNLIAGATNGTLTLTNIQGVQVNYDYYVVASNHYGATTSSIVTLNVLSGAPTLVADVNPPLTIVPAGTPVTFFVMVVGTEPFAYQWSSGSGPIAGATGSSYTFDALAGTNNYSVAISNSVGPVTSSTAVVVGLTAAPPIVTFAGNGSNWTFNQGVNWPGSPSNPSITNDVLTLTDGTNSEACSAFFDIPQYVGGFIASFTYTAGGNRAADGITFCLQDSTNVASGLGATAVGAAGGDLGYYGISNSVAFELNLYTGSSGGSGIQLGTNGSTPDSASPSAPYFFPGQVNIASGDPIDVQISYSQNVLNVSLADATAGTKFTTSFIVPNLPAIVGGSSAYIGFTGGDGDANSIQTVSNFVFSSVTQSILSITREAPESVVISWPAAVSSQFVLQQSTALNGTWSNVSGTPVVVNSQNQVTLTITNTTFYRLIKP